MGTRELSLVDFVALSPNFSASKDTTATLSRLSRKYCLIRHGTDVKACVYRVCTSGKGSFESATHSLLMRCAITLFGLPETPCAIASIPGKSTSKKRVFLCQIPYNQETSEMVEPSPVPDISTARDSLLRFTAVSWAFGYNLSLNQVLTADNVYYPSSFTRKPLIGHSECKIARNLSSLHDGLPRLLCDIFGITSLSDLAKWRLSIELELRATVTALGPGTQMKLQTALNKVAASIRSRIAFLKKIAGENVLEDSYGLQSHQGEFKTDTLGSSSEK